MKQCHVFYIYICYLLLRFIDPHLNVQVNTNGSRFTFTLVIRDLTVVDMGIYSCTVKKYGVDNSAWPEKSTFLSVKSK